MTKQVQDFFVSLKKIDNAKYIVDYTKKFEKNVELCFSRNNDLTLLKNAITILAQKGSLPKEYKPHPLKGFPKKNSIAVLECHIRPDWLLIWLQNDNELTLALTNTGTHSDLF